MTTKFEIHLQYTFAPFIEVIACDRMIYGNGIIRFYGTDDNWQKIFMSSIAPEPGWGIE